MSAVTSSNALLSKKKPGARRSPILVVFFRLFEIVFLFSAVAVCGRSQEPVLIAPGPKPMDIPKDWKDALGIYSGDDEKKRSFVLLEQDGKLLWCDEKGACRGFRVLENSVVFVPSEGAVILGHNMSRDKAGRVEGFCFRYTCYKRKSPGQISLPLLAGNPIVSVEQLRLAALATSPPIEQRPFRQPDLVELAPLDPAIHLDIRYATANDFLGVPVYTQARAFLQRPAAEALLRVLHKLQPLGYGLLIHDGYRPWYVTKIFWDATPPEGKIFVADPAQGSRHNRGCAVDLTLYDLKSGEPVEMTGGYDEMSPRSFPNYPGGTSLQRWHRDLLRRAMESEGFTVYESEWWHFDYKDWHEYGILNIPFEKLSIGSNAK